MALRNGRPATRRRPTAGWITGVLGLTLLASTAGSVQAGLLDALFGGAAFAPPRYYDEDVPRPRRRVREERVPAPDTYMETPPLLQGATCCKNGEDPMKALLNDDTLVRGDVVMTPEGLRTFIGARAPHSMSNFQPVGKSTAMSSTRRKELLALDR